MSYHLPLTLGIAFFLTACTTVTEKPKVKTVYGDKIIAPVSSNHTRTILEIPMQVDSIELQGNYTLEKGQISFGDIRKTINRSDLVIEQLNENDFGYYYTVQVAEHSADIYFGIFHYKDGDYVQKIISDGGEVSYYDNIELIQEENRLKLTLKTSQGKRIIIWHKNDEETPTKELLKAKKSYNEVCKIKYNELGLN